MYELRNKIILEIFKPSRKIFDKFLRNTLWFAYYIIKAKNENW